MLYRRALSVANRDSFSGVHSPSVNRDTLRASHFYFYTADLDTAWVNEDRLCIDCQERLGGKVETGTV